MGGTLVFEELTGLQLSLPNNQPLRNGWLLCNQNYKCIDTIYEKLNIAMNLNKLTIAANIYLSKANNRNSRYVKSVF